MPVEFIRAADGAGPDASVLTFSFRQNYPAENGELGPTAGSGTNALAGFYFIRGPGPKALLTEDFTVQLPAWSDLDGDGVDDFYQADRSVPDVAANGAFEDALGRGGGALGVTWSRQAGTNVGSCLMQFNSASIAGQWEVPFRIRQADGAFDYAVRGADVTGQVLIQTPDGRCSGLLALKRLGPDRLRIVDGSWLVANTRVSFVAQGPIVRQGNHYVGTVLLSDGNLRTSFPDYQLWTISIADPNDSDGNGVPDLSDSVPMEAPRLAIETAAGRLVLSIGGTVGQTCELEGTPTLNPATWTGLQSILITNSIQTTSLPLATGADLFLRLRVP
jgi:hypothetical protein